MIGLTWIAIGPIIPDPRSGLIRNVAGVFLQKLPIDIEGGVSLHPINTVLVYNGDILRRRTSSLSRLSAAAQGLIGKPKRNGLAGTRV